MSLEEVTNNIYKSINSYSSELDSEILAVCLVNGIYPEKVEYTKYGTGFAIYKGDIYNFYKEDDLYTFEKSLEIPDLNFDYKFIYNDTLSKAMGSPGGGGNSQVTNPVPLTEEEAINRQNMLLTEDHPGAATASTPDRPDVGRDWHGTNKSEEDEEDKETNKSLRLFGNILQQQVLDTKLGKTSLKERQYMKEVLNKSIEDMKFTKLTPTEKRNYNKWLNKSLLDSVSNLDKLMDK